MCEIILSHKYSFTDDLRSITYYIICTLTRIENVLIYAPFFFVLFQKNIMLPAGDRYYQLINVFIRKKAKVREFFSRYHMIFIFSCRSYASREGTDLENLAHKLTIIIQ